MGTRSQKKGDKIRELFAAPALHSAQKATDRHPRRGHSPTFVPVPKTQATASHSAWASIFKGLFRHASQPLNSSEHPDDKGRSWVTEGWLAGLEARARYEKTWRQEAKPKFVPWAGEQGPSCLFIVSIKEQTTNCDSPHFPQKSSLPLCQQWALNRLALCWEFLDANSESSPSLLASLIIGKPSALGGWKSSPAAWGGLGIKVSASDLAIPSMFLKKKIKNAQCLKLIVQGNQS